jgi:hypothetical protein
MPHHFASSSSTRPGRHAALAVVRQSGVAVALGEPPPVGADDEREMVISRDPVRDAEGAV